MVNQRYKEAFVELLDILEHTEREEVDKIPKKLIDFFRENASTNYKINLDHSKEIADMELKRETLSLLSMLYRNYWCTPEERAEYDKILDDNERKYQEELREKYNPDKIFEKTTEQKEEDSINSNLPVEIKKETFYQKLVNFLKNFFKKT